MNVFKRIFCLMLALLCCLGIFAGCKEEPEEEPQETQSEEITEAPTDPKLVSSLQSNYNFKNQEFTILTRKQTDYEFKGKSDEKATFLEREVFERNEYVMDHCKVEFNIVTRMGGWDDRSIFTSAAAEVKIERSSQPPIRVTMLNSTLQWSITYSLRSKTSRSRKVAFSSLFPLNS